MNKNAQELLYGKGGIEAFANKQLEILFEGARENMGIGELEEWVSKNTFTIFSSIENEVIIEESEIREKKDSGWFKDVNPHYAKVAERIWVNGYCFDVWMEIWRNPENMNEDIVLFIPKSMLAMEIRRFL